MTNWTQHAQTCEEHDGCQVIVCINDETGWVAWESHASDEQAFADRSNPDVLLVDDTATEGPIA